MAVTSELARNGNRKQTKTVQMLKGLIEASEMLVLSVVYGGFAKAEINFYPVFLERCNWRRVFRILYSYLIHAAT